MDELSPDVLRKGWWELSPNAHILFKILYETQDYVPEQKLVEKIFIAGDSLTQVLGWIAWVIGAAEGGLPYRGGDFQRGFESDSGGYRLKDHLRPVVGELLGHHKEGKTILLESLWNMARMVKSLENRIGDIPDDIPANFAMEFKSCQQELERLSQDLFEDR